MTVEETVVLVISKVTTRSALMTIVVVCLIQIITICLCVENDRDKTIIWLLFEQKQMKAAISAALTNQWDHVAGSAFVAL